MTTRTAIARICLSLCILCGIFTCATAIDGTLRTVHTPQTPRARYAIHVPSSGIISSAQAEDVHFALRQNVPPYFIKETNSGIEYEIIEAALAQKGHLLVPHFMPPGRVRYMLRTNKLHAASHMPYNLSATGIYLSASHITYRNVIVIPKAWKKRITSLQDLANVPVTAFNNAHSVLPDDFKRMAARNTNYNEISSQQSQVAGFHARQNRAIVIDERIFLYYTSQTLPRNRADYCILRILPPNRYCIGFTDKHLRDDFNEGLQELHSTGAYAEILNRHIEGQ